MANEDFGIAQGDSTRSMYHMVTESGPKFLEDANPIHFKQTTELPQQKSITELGFPTIDPAFWQEAPHKSEGVVDSVVQGVEHFFGQAPTVEEKLRQNIEKNMTPKEREEYDKETEAQERYGRRLMGTMEPPVPPSMKMHAELQERLREVEAEISKSVRDNMSPELRKALEEEQQASIEKARQNHDRPESLHKQVVDWEPGPATKEYNRLIAEATEKYISNH